MEDEGMRKVLAVCVLLTALLLIPVTIVSALPITSVTTIDGNTITVTYQSSVPISIDPSTPDYDVSEGTVTYGGNTYDAVGIINDYNGNGGIADPEGNVNVTLDLNDARPFAIEIHHVNGENSKLRFIVTIDGTTHQYTSNISGNVRHYIGYEDKYFGISNLVSADDWIQSDNTVNIQIYNYNGHVPDNVTLKIVFKP